MKININEYQIKIMDHNEMKRKNVKKQFVFFMIIFVLLIFLVQCSVIPRRIFHKDSETYGKKRGQWKIQWLKYYQRGNSYSKDQYWDSAARDYQEAIKLRPIDQRWFQPDGWHIQDQYFPHRELGIIYYQQRRFKDAITELEISLSQFESAKARYFLNLAREALLEKTGQDVVPPKINIEFPQNGLLTNSSVLSISGEVTDDQYVKSIFVNKEGISVEIPSEKIEFQTEIGLERGENRILIEAIDLVGRNVRKEIVIWCDWRAPIIYIDRIAEDREGLGYSIEGYISDLSGVAGFWLNGTPIDLAYYKEGEFSVRLPIFISNKPVKFNAVDILGNKTSGKIDIQGILRRTNTEMSLQSRVAFLGQNLKKGLISFDTEPNESNKRTDSGPIIRLKDIPDQLKVDWEECFLEGEVRDLEGVTGLTINGVSLVNRTARIVFFNFKMPLEVGINEITIQAEGLSGKIITKKLSIERKLNPVQKIGSRLKLAIIPLKYFGERSEIKDLLYDALIQNLVKQERFQIVEREKIKVMLDTMNEKEKDSQSIMELGKVISAEGIVVGSAYFYDDYLEIIARLIDAETSVILDSEEVFGPVRNLEDISFLAEGLSLKFKQAFPFVEGHVVNIENESIRIDLGEKDRILPYTKMIFFREDEPLRHPGSELVLEKRFIILGEGRIKKVYGASSDVEVVLEKDLGQIKVGDKVITK